MTAEEWKKAEERLNAFQMVDLLIDGYTVTLMLCRDNMKLYITVYVNGKVKGEWLTKDCEERRRFMCKSKKCLLKPSDRKKLKLTKTEYEELREKYTIYNYTPYFSSFRTLKSQFVKNNQNIQLDLHTKGND